MLLLTGTITCGQVPVPGRNGVLILHSALSSPGSSSGVDSAPEPADHRLRLADDLILMGLQALVSVLLYLGQAGVHHARANP